MTDSAESALAARLTSDLELPRATLRGHGGDVRIEVADGGRVMVRFEGACNGCPYVAMTYFATIKPVIDRSRGVAEVLAPQVHVSSRAERRIVEMLVDRPAHSRTQP